MEDRHKDAFLGRLDRVITHGVTEVHKEEIKLWFGQERVARRTWRQIADMWNEMVEDSDQQKLIVAGLDTDHWIFAWGEGMGTSEESYFSDVRWLAGRTSANGSNMDLLDQAAAEREVEAPARRRPVRLD
ncbi:hypothetical protein I6F11_24305 [Ensifer sp. NBAIM29]|nr:hypothetical protein [Ensifer sp. NBAIM29]